MKWLAILFMYCFGAALWLFQYILLVIVTPFVFLWDFNVNRVRRIWTENTENFWEGRYSFSPKYKTIHDFARLRNTNVKR